MGVRHMDKRKFNKVPNQRNLYIRDSVYYFRYKQKWTTLKATTKAEAIKEKDQLLAQKKLGILNDLYYSSKNTKLVDMLNEYVKWIETSPDGGLNHKDKMSPSLVLQKKLYLSIIFDYFPNNIKTNDLNISKYFSKALEDIRKRPGKKGNEYLSQSSIKNYKTTLSGAFTWAIKEGVYNITHNPIKTTKDVKSLNIIDPYKSKHHELWERSEFDLALEEYTNNKTVQQIYYPLFLLVSLDS